MPSVDLTEAPSAAFPDLPPFPADIPTAPLLRLSLQRLLDDEAEERQRLWKACTELGFFYLDLRGAHGVDDLDGDTFNHEADRLFQVAEEFYSLPLKEKQKYDFKEQGSYFGYKGYGSGFIDKNGTTDRNEFYNVSKDDIFALSDPIPAPNLFETHRPLLRSWISTSHSIVTLLLDRLNTGLGLPQGTLQSLHRLSAPSGDQVRFVKSPPQPAQDRRAALGAHSDFGSITILCNRLGGLQILPPGAPSAEDAQPSDWLYVQPLRGHCIVNLGDAMVKFTRGVLRSNVHRVVNPPGEQAGEVRYSLVYFARPEDDVVLKALDGSSVVGKKGLGEKEEEGVTAKEWVLRRALGRRGVGDWSKSGGTEGVGRNGGTGTSAMAS